MSNKRTMPSGHRWVPSPSSGDPSDKDAIDRPSDVIRCEGCGAYAQWSENDSSYLTYDLELYVSRDVLPSCAQECARDREILRARHLLIDRAIGVLRTVMATVGDDTSVNSRAIKALLAVVDVASTAILDGLLAPPALLVERDGAVLVLENCGLVHRTADWAFVLTTGWSRRRGPSLVLNVRGHVWSWSEIAAALVSRVRTDAHDMS